MPIWEVETPNGLVEIDSETPPTPEMVKVAATQFGGADLNTGSNTSGMGGATSNQSRGGGFTGRIGDDTTGIVESIKDIARRGGGDPIKGISSLLMDSPQMIDRMIQGGAEQVQPFLPTEDTGGSLGRFLGSDPLRGAQAGLAAIPGLGRTVQSGQDLSEGKEGALGELTYDTLMALSPKVGPKVNRVLDAGLDSAGAARSRLGSSIQQNAVTRLDDISDMPDAGIRGLLGDPNLWKKRILAGGAAGVMGADPSTVLGMALAPDMLRAVKTSPTIARGQAGLGRMLAGEGAPRPRRRFMSEMDTGDYPESIGPEPAPNRIKTAEESWAEVPDNTRTNITGSDLGNFEPLPYEKLPNIGRSSTRRVPGEDIPSASSPIRNRPGRSVKDPIDKDHSDAYRENSARRTSREESTRNEASREDRRRERKAYKKAQKEEGRKEAKPKEKYEDPDAAEPTAKSSTGIPSNGNPFSREYVKTHGGPEAEAMKVWDGLNQEMKDKLIKNPKYRARWIRTVNRRGSRASNSNPRAKEQEPVSIYSDPDGPGWNKSIPDNPAPIGPSNQIPDDVAEAFRRSRQELDPPMTDSQVSEGLRSLMKKARNGDPEAIELLRYLEEVEAKK